MVNSDVAIYNSFHRSYRYIFGDESGDTGFAFERGSSRYFVISLLLLNDPDLVCKRIRHLRQLLRLPAYREFKFNKTPDVNRLIFLEGIESLPFKGYAFLVNKSSLPSSWQRMSDSRFYASCFAKLMVQLPVGGIQGAMLTLDQFGSPEVTIREIRRAIKKEPDLQMFPFQKIAMKRSKGNDLLQCADMVAGAVMRAWNGKDNRFFDVVRSKVAVCEYPPK